MTNQSHKAFLFRQDKRAPASRSRDMLALDILVALTVKLIAIFALWYAFFSHPLDGQLTDRSVSHALVGATVVPQNTSHTETK